MIKMLKAKNSLFKKLLPPLLIVMTLQAAVVYGSILFGGTVDTMRSNSFDIFSESVSNRSSYLENEMLKRRSGISDTAEKFSQQAESFLNINKIGIGELTFKSDASQRLLTELSDGVLNILKMNYVTGAFVILDGNGNKSKDGVYFRDVSPESNSSKHEDVLAERAPNSVTKKHGIALSTQWQPYFDFTNMPQAEKNYYVYPFNAAEAAFLDKTSIKLAQNNDLCYWSPSHSVNYDKKNNYTKAVTYSIPLLLSNGMPYGVLGIELDTAYLNEIIPSGGTGGVDKNGYAIVTGSALKNRDNEKNYRISTVVGAYYKSAFSHIDTLALSEYNNQPGFYQVNNAEPANRKEVICAKAIPLKLYNQTSPFVDEQWMLLGFSTSSELTKFTSEFVRLVVFSLIMTTLVGIVGIFFVAVIISEPIQRLSKKMKEAPSNAPVKISHINIAEIDEMLNSIEYFSTKALDSASRLSKILEMTNVSIGAFEYDKSIGNEVHCTGSLFDMLDFGDDAIDASNLTIEVFERTIEKLYRQMEETTADAAVICKTKRNGGDCWLRVRRVVYGNRIMGVVTDITTDVLERKRIEHDRDYDLLTNIYNRRAFKIKVEELFENPEQLKISAMLMIDLDNLKYVNDTYGHDYGDEYIRMTAEVLEKFADSGCLVARQSGDEFTVFFHGYGNQTGIRESCEDLQRKMAEARVKMPDNTFLQIRASAGISWYPEDAMTFEELSKYADFAMYMVKRSNKGEFTEFNLSSYNQKAYLLRCCEELNKLIENNLVQYVFQPIVNAKDGSIFAYEALMRPMSENIKTPLELLALAQSQSKLAQIEYITFFCALESFSQLPASKEDCKLFINSIANQILDNADIESFEQKYGDYLSRLVVEITESEEDVEHLTAKKRSIIERWKSAVALDDYGSGYNGDLRMLSIVPEYVKVDMSIIRGIDKDKDRLQILRGLLSYTKNRNIMVIAEGVESYEEMETLIAEGVDLMQGYYLSKPFPNPPLSLPIMEKKIVALNKLPEEKQK